MEMNLFLLLPMEIAEDLFSRVPFDSILQCKVVCKALKDLVNQLSFVEEHRRRRKGRKGYLFRLCDIEPGFHYGEYKEKVTRFNLTTKPKVTPFNFSTEPVISHSITSHHHRPFGDATQWCIVGSCNGLICLRHIFHQERGTGHDDMYVCNPYKSDYLKLPKSSYHQLHDHDVKIAYGFGYHRITGEYKVIRIYYHIHQRKSSSSSGYVEVYTLGSSTGWRPIEEINHKLYREGLHPGEIKHKLYREDPDGEFQNNSYGVFVQVTGALYWITKKNHIISFNLAEEKFQVIAMPPVNIVCPSVLAVLGGCLCVTIDEDDLTHIWVLSKNDCSCPTQKNQEDDSCSWIEKNKKICSCHWKNKIICSCPCWIERNMNKKNCSCVRWIKKNKKNCSCLWIEKFSIPWRNYMYNDPLAMLEDGKILLHSNFEIVSYDPKTESFVEIEKLIRFDVISYVKSSVSFKALARKKKITHEERGAAAAAAARN